MVCRLHFALIREIGGLLKRKLEKGIELQVQHRETAGAQLKLKKSGCCRSADWRM
jgi:hypothetical protein